MDIKLGWADGCSIINFWIALKCGWLLSLINWNNTDSWVVKIAPLACSLWKKKHIFKLLLKTFTFTLWIVELTRKAKWRSWEYLDEVASATMKTFKPSSIRSSAVCCTHTWAWNKKKWLDKSLFIVFINFYIQFLHIIFVLNKNKYIQ